MCVYIYKYTVLNTPYKKKLRNFGLEIKEYLQYNQVLFFIYNLKIFFFNQACVLLRIIGYSYKQLMMFSKMRLWQVIA